MSNSNYPYTYCGICPVIERTVTLRIISIRSKNLPDQIDKNCSQLRQCLQTYQSLAQIPNCLLHKF